MQKNGSQKCALCGHEVHVASRKENEEAFCCPGCQAVYEILSKKAELENFHNNPLFLQALKSGLISNPALLEEIQASHASMQQEEEIEKLYFEIEDLWCPSCAQVISLFLCRERGIKKCVVDYATDLAAVDYIPRYISKEKIFSLIKKIGYSPKLFDSPEMKADQMHLRVRLIVSAFFSLNIMMLSYPIYASYFSRGAGNFTHLFSWISFFASLPVLFYGGMPIIRRFLSALAFGIFGMEALVILGVAASFGLSVYELSQGKTHVYFDSMSVIITLVLFGKLMESRAKFSTKETLFHLSKSLPKRGRKYFGAQEARFVPLKEVQKGDFLIALSGEKIVLDGVVVEGQATVDESLMTGEAIPIRKKEGDRVIAGSILCQGSLRYLVKAVETESVLHHLLETIEAGVNQKPHYSRAVDPIVRAFVPIVLILSVVSIGVALSFGSSYQDALIRAISVLLISCPCAIGIAAPLAESYTLHKMAKLGALIRNRAVLALLGKEDVFVFDKTGTITKGHFVVLRGLERLSESQLEVLKSMVQKSTHPISFAIGQSLKVSFAVLNHCEEVIGKGIKASFEGNTYFLGSQKFMEENGIKISGNLKNSSFSHVYFALNRDCMTEIILGDQIKEEAKSVIQSIHPAQTVLLSGDSTNAVESVADACCFDCRKAEMTPLEKKGFVDELKAQGKIVAMMGDGINDAPALTSSHISISVMSATDLSIQVSDILLTKENLQIVEKARALASFGRKILNQNLFWAFFYNIIGIALAVSGKLTPLFSTAAMTISSLMVFLNARRISNKI